MSSDHESDHESNVAEHRMRAGGLRLLRVSVLVLAFGLALNSAGVFYTFKLNDDRVEQINAERHRNVVAGCLRDSGQNARIIGFLEDVSTNPSTLADARRHFPVLSRSECERVARSAIE